MKQFAFPKAEHLCLQREIDALFVPGVHSAVSFPLRAVFRPVEWEGGPAVKVLLSVSKRKHKLAVDRNRAKRQIREAYRKNKHLLLASLLPGEGVHIGFLWLSDAPVASAVVERRMVGLLQRIAEKIAQSR